MSCCMRSSSHGCSSYHLTTLLKSVQNMSKMHILEIIFSGLYKIKRKINCNINKHINVILNIKSGLWHTKTEKRCAFTSVIIRICRSVMGVLFFFGKSRLADYVRRRYACLYSNMEVCLPSKNVIHALRRVARHVWRRRDCKACRGKATLEEGE